MSATPPPPMPPLASPPPGELFTDPAARAVWAAVLTLDVALQHDFLTRLRERLAVPGLTGGTHAIRISRLVAAVREAEAMLLARASGKDGFVATEPPALTEDAYEALRRVHREFGWPPAASMRNWVQGGWNDVLARAMVKTVDNGDALFVRSGAGYTWDEVAGVRWSSSATIWRRRVTRIPPASGCTTSSPGRSCRTFSGGRAAGRAHRRRLTGSEASSSRRPPCLLAARAKLDVSGWRAVMTGKRDPTLRQVAKMSQMLRCRPTQLTMATPEDRGR